MNDIHNPTRGILVGVLIGTAFWVVALAVILL